MLWDDTARRQHNRDHPSVPSDLSDVEREFRAPLIAPLAKS